MHPQPSRAEPTASSALCESGASRPGRRDPVRPAACRGPLPLTMRRWTWAWAWFIAVPLTACALEDVPVPPSPPAPPTPPVPPTPPPQPPPPVTGVATWEAVKQVIVGQTRQQVYAILAVAPKFDTAQDDGTEIAEWPSVGPANEPEYLDVHFRNNVVIGRARLPRAN